MANAAAKKAAKIGEITSRKYLPYIIFSSLFYIGVQLLWRYQTSTIWHYVYFILYSLIYLICQYGLIQSAQDKTQNEMYFDAFCVNFLAEIISSFTNWGRSILLLIPGYLLYLGVNWYLSYRKANPTPAPESHEDTSSQSTEKKKTRTKYASAGRR
jgi:hypothetical protein